MVSGMDTESLVTALVSGYQLKKDNLVKAQTKLSWKQEKWKTMNTSIYSFYSGKLSSARFGKAYSLKKSTVSNSSVATVTASSSAVAGDQTLKAVSYTHLDVYKRQQKHTLYGCYKGKKVCMYDR